MEFVKDRSLHTVLASAFLHALFLSLFLLFVFKTSEEGRNSPIEVEAVTQKTSENHLRKTLSSHARAIPPTPSQSKGISLSDLGMRLDPLTEARSPAVAENEIQTENNDWDIMNPDPRIARFNQYIYNTVQGWLDRDVSHRLEEFYGTVKLKIWFNKEGEYLEDQTLFDAIDPNFKHFVRDILRKSFSRPIPKPYIFQKDDFYIIRTVVIRKD